MTARLLAGAALLALPLALGCAGREPSPAAPEPAAVADTETSVAELPPRSWLIPRDVRRTGATDLTGVQREFDTFAWQAFVAINWPALPNGEPDTRRQIGDTPTGDNTTVWRHWKAGDEVMRADGKPPTPWGVPRELPEICQPGDDAASGQPVLLAQTGKAPLDKLHMFNQAFETGPIVDRNGRYARFEILINQQMFDYIVDNDLWSQAGQERFMGEVDFPQGSLTTDRLGAIMLKAAWKELGPRDDPRRFHVIDSWVYTGAARECRRARLGLVGLHIVARTERSPNWAWATFEHADNAPTFNRHRDGNYLFFDPASDAEINTAPPRPWDPSRIPQPPTQVVRLTPLDAVALEANAIWRRRLTRVNPRSVWRNYILISTQWSAGTPSPRNPLGSPVAPSFLANTTMETYIQGVVEDGEVRLVPNATSSCMHCHNNATMRTGKSSGFTYLLSEAK